MEKELFDWEGWDEFGVLILSFYNCTLKAPIGDFEVGSKISVINMNYEDGTIELIPDVDEGGAIYKLVLSIGARIQS